MAVVSTSGSGTLSDVASLIADGGYCALLTSGGVDCWGYCADGALGDGQLSDSAIPVAVVSTSGSGALRGVNSLAADNEGGNCAQLTSGGVDCWGNGNDGELGNGQFYTSGIYGSAVPVAVVSTSGSGTLGNVASLTGGGSGEAIDSYCALLTSGEVDCWGGDVYGNLGNGQSSDSAVPVTVTFPPS